MAVANKAFAEDRTRAAEGKFSSSLVYAETFNRGTFSDEDIRDADKPAPKAFMDVINRLMGIQDKEIRRFLNFVGVPVGEDDTTEQVKVRLKLAGLIMQHVVTDDQRINGYYFFERQGISKNHELICIISDPFYEDGKIKIVRRVPE